MSVHTCSVPLRLWFSLSKTTAAATVSLVFCEFFYLPFSKNVGFHIGSHRIFDECPYECLVLGRSAPSSWPTPSRRENRVDTVTLTLWADEHLGPSALLKGSKACAWRRTLRRKRLRCIGLVRNQGERSMQFNVV